MAKEKNLTVFAMWPRHIKGTATGTIYDFDMGHYTAAVYRRREDQWAGIIFCYNNFVKEGMARKPVVIACDENGSPLPVEFFTLEEK